MPVCREQSQETQPNALPTEQLSLMAPLAMEADSKHWHWHEPLCCKAPVGIHNLRETRTRVLSVLMPVERLLGSLSVDPVTLSLSECMSNGLSEPLGILWDRTAPKP